MSDQKNHVDMQVRTDRSTVGIGGGDVHVLVDLEAGTRPSAVDRLPLNLALVIDASGSMGGAPLEAAKMAVRAVADRLGPEDRLTVVSFADDVVVHTRAVAVDAAAGRQIEQVLADLHTRGCTDLGAGWLGACEVVATEMERRAEADLVPVQNRVLVLSDGYANTGLVESAQLAEHAAALRQRGLYTSTVGIGDGYSPTQLHAIAMHGGGRLHDAPLGEDIVAVVLGELSELRNTMGNDVVVIIHSSSAVKVEVPGQYPVTRKGSFHTVGVGSLGVSGTRQLAVRLVVLAANLGTHHEVTARMTWVDPVSGIRREGPVAGVRVTVADAATVASEELDQAVGLAVAGIWQQHLQLESTLLNSDGLWEEANDLMVKYMPDLVTYCECVSGTEDLLRDLSDHAETVKAEMPAGDVLRQVSESSRCLLQTKDYRVNKRS